MKSTSESLGTPARQNARFPRNRIGARLAAVLLVCGGCSYHTDNGVSYPGPNPGNSGPDITFTRYPLPGLTGPPAISYETPPYVIGTANDGSGNLSVLNPATVTGLQALYQAPRVAYDLVTADFDGDGLPDVFSGVYSPTNVDSSAQLYHSDASGWFSPDVPFGIQYTAPSGAVGYRGRTETDVVADFANNGSVDIYVPAYSYLDSVHDLSGDPAFTSGGPPPNVYNALQSFLLLNDGTGHFTEHAVEAGVSMHSSLSGLMPPSADPEGVQPEGVQAVDFNMDGLIDLYAGGHLFINQGVDENGVPHFKDMAAAWGLTQAILHAAPPWNPSDVIPDTWLVTDEGAKFLDWNNDGHLDLLLYRWNWGPAHGARLFEFTGTQFVERIYASTEKTPTCQHPPAQPTAFFWSSKPLIINSPASGINAYDLDNDGLEDILVSGDGTNGSSIFHNYGCGFVEVPASELGGRPGGTSSVALADFNGDGKIDAVYADTGGLAYYINTTKTPEPSSFTVEVVGTNGEHNQYGRVIQVFPPGTSQIYTRVVDSGSGYLTQNQYPILVGTPFSGPHTVKVYFAPLTKCMYGGPPCQPAILSFSIEPGQRAMAYGPSVAHPTGVAVVTPGP